MLLFAKRKDMRRSPPSIDGTGIAREKERRGLHWLGRSSSRSVFLDLALDAPLGQPTEHVVDNLTRLLVETTLPSHREDLLIAKSSHRQCTRTSTNAITNTITMVRTISITMVVRIIHEQRGARCGQLEQA